MADKTQQSILKITLDNAAAIKAMGDYQEEIESTKRIISALTAQNKSLEDSFRSGAISQAEYMERTRENTDSINRYKQTQKALQTQLSQVQHQMQKNIQQNIENDGSLKSLRGQLSQLNSQYDSLTREERENKDVGGALQKQIADLTKEIQTAEEATGRHQRNVGNYSSALKGLEGSFRATAGGAGAIINPIKNVTGGLEVMSKTPVIAILGLLASIIQKVISGLKTSEGNLTKVREAFAVFNVAGDAATKVLQFLAKGLTAVGNGLTWLLDKLGLVDDAMRERQAIAREETELLQLERENIYKNADAELEVSELRAKAYDKTKYSAQERVKMLEKAGSIEKDISERSLKAAQLAYDIIKRKNALTESSTEDLKAEADAYAKVVSAQVAYNNKMRNLTRQLSSARQEAHNDALQAARALSNAEIKLLEAQLAEAKTGSESQLAIQLDLLRKRYASEVANAKETIKNKKALNKTLEALEKRNAAQVEAVLRQHNNTVVSLMAKRMENQMNVYASGTKEFLKAQVDLRKYEFENLTRMDKESDEAFNARRLAAQRAYYDSVQALNNRIIAEGRQAYENIVNEAERGSEAQLEAIVNLKSYELEHLQKQMGETEDEFYARQLAARQAYNDAVKNLIDSQDNEERLRLENNMNSFRDSSLDALKAKVDLKKYELDTLHQLEGESNEEFRARQLEADKAYTAAKQELYESQIQMVQDAASSVSSLLGTLADVYEEDAEASKESQEKVKALRIAGATIDMLSGVVAAVSQAMKLGFPIGPIVGAAQSAAVIAAGSSNIAKMKSQKLAKGGYVSGPGTGTSDSVPAQLSNGESVMNARATSMFAPLLSSLNQIGGGNAIVPPAGADTEVLEQAIARGMRGANLSVSVTEIDTVRQRMDNIEGNANV